MTTIIPTIFTTNLYVIALLFAITTFTYASFTTMANVMPSDLFNSESVASVSGLSGTGTGIGTIVAFKLIGYFADARQATGTHSFDPIIIIAGLLPLVGMILVLLLMRNTEATNRRPGAPHLSCGGRRRRKFLRTQSQTKGTLTIKRLRDTSCRS
jgi:MFS transporter, ACS family, hexuronate transporter